MLFYIIVSWFLSALALWLVSRIVAGMELRGFGDALIATVVIAVVNFFIGPILRFFSFPLTILTLGLFLIVINALLLKLASMLSPGFRIRGFLSAVIGSILLSILNWLLRLMVF
jgi:putative membrane protein